MYGSTDTSVKPGGAPALVVLAGGHGRRLGGVPKGLIRLANGQTVVERLLSLARGPAFVIANVSEWYERVEAVVVADLVPDKGAPGGLVTGLAVAPTEWVFVLACDMPFVTRAMLDELQRHAHPGADAVCFSRDGQLEPLVGLYRRALCFDWAPRLDGNPSLRELVNGVRVEMVRSEEPHRLTSLNSPDDLRNAAESFRDPDDAGTLPALSW